MRRLFLGLGAAALLACGSSGGDVSLQLSRPTSVAVWYGRTAKHPDVVHPYVAVADAPDGELVLIDAVDDEPVESPVTVWPLSVPVPGTPVMLAAGRLGDDVPGEDPAVEPTRRPDLLVVGALGSLQLAQIDTWSGAPGVVAEPLDLAALAPGQVLVSLATGPVPAAGGSGAEPGKVRLYCGLTGGQLVVVDYERQGEAVVRVALAVQALGFEPAAITAGPDGAHLYVATRDPIPPADVFGVAELDATGAPGAFTVTAMPTLAPTRLVAAARLRERAPGAVDVGVDDPVVDRVYAVLDERFCGRTEAIPCGIAVIDPTTHALLPDPVGELPWLTPIAVPGTPLALAVSTPPVNPPTGEGNSIYAGALMRIAPGSGQRATAAVLSVAAADGVVYMVDLSRWQVSNNRSILRSGSRTSVTGGFALTGNSDAFPVPGVWQEVDAEGNAIEPQVVADAVGAALSVRVTPGYTDSDVWTVTYQGVLPNLGERQATAGEQDGLTWVAVQTELPGGRFTDVADVHGPALGVRVGDLVAVGFATAEDRTPYPQCPEAGFETAVARVLPPDPVRFPGGALLLADPADAALRACLDSLAAGRDNKGADGVEITVRVPAYVLTSGNQGYAGRPRLLVAPTGEEYSGPAWAPDASFDCPPILAPPAVCATEDCRLQCEQLLIARKARRIYHVADRCRGTQSNDAACVASWPPEEYPFPLATGPAVGFKLGVLVDPVNGGTATPARGAFFRFSTQNGIAPASRQPSNAVASILPTSLATFDRSTFPGKADEGYRIYAAYTGGFVLDFSHAVAPSAHKIVR